VVRWTAFIVSLGGLFFTAKLSHEGRLREAFLFLLFDTLVVLIFVLAHVLVEWLLPSPNNRSHGTWWRGR
jgi:hypothetical protein